MPKSDAQSKSDRHYRLIKLFDSSASRWRTCDLAQKLGVDEETIRRDIYELGRNGRLPLRKEGRYWMLVEDARLSHLPVRLNLSEATALFIAGRLLSQIHDERNRFVVMALTKLIDALPELLRAPQSVLVDMAEQRQMDTADRSGIFEALALGWTQQRQVRLLYAPPRKRKFETLFSPYLLEPSAIGHTIYAIGKSSVVDDLRTYKLERIEHAELTDIPFTVDEDFDGPALLSRAWGVMYGDGELFHVRLRFSHYVTKRVRETLWHPSQELKDTPDGCVLTLQIGELIEIENWVRGWGADCEVLEPAELREKIVDDVRRAARLYGVLSPVVTDEDSDTLADF